MPKARIAIAIGDPAGIGPEISLKAVRAPAVRALCDPILCGDPDVLARHAEACGLAADLRIVERVADANSSPGVVTVLACRQPEAAALPFGAIDAAGGRASIAFAAAAVDAARAGDVDAAVGAPQNETAIARAGITFDGHPGFVARPTGTDPDDVYLMLCFDRFRIAHCTLHVGVRDAVTLLTRQQGGKTIRATDRALKRLGIATPRICVGGLKPHAGEGGLFGREEIEIIAPAITDAAAAGIAGVGPLRRRHHVPPHRRGRLRGDAARPGPHHRQAPRPRMPPPRSPSAPPSSSPPWRTAAPTTSPARASRIRPR